MILFRAFKKEKGEWIKGFYWVKPTTQKTFISRWVLTDTGEGFWCDEEVFPQTVGQLHNKLSEVEHYGERVFVGDILKIYYKNKPSEKIILETVEFWDDNIIGCEVIGNSSFQTLDCV